MADGFKARIAAQNAQGGVNGRKIDAEIIDDKSSNANLTAAQDFVENRDVFAIVNDSSFGFLSYRYEVGAGVPVIGGGFDGDYYSQPGNESIISVLGNVSADPDITSMVFANAMKRKGATKIAALAYGVSPASANAVKSLQKYAVPAAGMKAVYTNTSVDFGSSDVGPLVLGIKNSGANAVDLPMSASTNIAVAEGLEQAAIPMKAVILGSGYGQEVLDSPASAALGPEDLFFQQTKPAELNDAAVKRFRSDLKKYVGYTQVPGYGHYQGYLAADLLVTGLEHAGKDLTRQKFVDNLRKLGTWGGAGLTCQPVDISLANYGKFPKQDCAYYSYVKDGKFVTAFGGKAITGKIVGSPEALAANADQRPVTTTSAAATASMP
jgi:branched-chain amino acid transport system substrate-binding protein